MGKQGFQVNEIKSIPIDTASRRENAEVSSLSTLKKKIHNLLSKIVINIERKNLSALLHKLSTIEICQ